MCIKKKIEVEMRWQINKQSNIFFFRFTFSTYLLSDSTHFFVHIYIYGDWKIDCLKGKYFSLSSHSEYTVHMLIDR